jgi:hypothetical protein
MESLYKIGVKNRGCIFCRLFIEDVYNSVKKYAFDRIVYFSALFYLPYFWGNLLFFGAFV